MQLFSVGLYKLNMDGSFVVLENGKFDETYTIEDIMSYSRAWTGFSLPPLRGGVSSAGRQWLVSLFELNRLRLHCNKKIEELTQHCTLNSHRKLYAGDTV